MCNKRVDDSVWQGSGGYLNEALHDLSDGCVRKTVWHSLLDFIAVTTTGAVDRAVYIAVWQEPEHPALAGFANTERGQLA